VPNFLLVSAEYFIVEIKIGIASDGMDGVLDRLLYVAQALILA
jgi:hypothetical protein